MSEIEKPGIVAETCFRLFKELAANPEFKQMVDQRNANARAKREAEILLESPGLDEVTVKLAVLFRELNQERLINRVFTRTQNRMLEILLAGLSEKSQREAVQQLRALTPEDVLRDLV